MQAIWGIRTLGNLMTKMKNKQFDLSARFFRYIYDIRRYCMHNWYTFWYGILSRMMGVTLGKRVAFNGPITIDRFKYSRIVIGDGCVFNSHWLFNPRGISRCMLTTTTDSARIIIGAHSGMSGVSIVARKEVCIGNNVNIGAGTRIGDSDDHPELLDTKIAPINIGNNVFIGMNSLILKGVSIGDNSVIGAGSVVTKSIPANCIAAGVPCKVIRQID